MPNAKNGWWGEGGKQSLLSLLSLSWEKRCKMLQHEKNSRGLWESPTSSTGLVPGLPEERFKVSHTDRAG